MDIFGYMFIVKFCYVVVDIFFGFIYIDEDERWDGENSIVYY